MRKPIFSLIAYLLFSGSFYPLFGQSSCFFPGDDQRWDYQFRRPGISSTAVITDFLEDQQGRLFISSFTAARPGGDPEVGQHLYFWDGEKYGTVGGVFSCTSCGTGRINDLEMDSQGNIFAAGFFDGAQNENGSFVSSRAIIKWNVSSEQYEAIGLEVNNGAIRGEINDLELWQDSIIYVTGKFTELISGTDTIAANHVAFHNLNSGKWFPMGNGLNAGCVGLTSQLEGFSLAVNPVGQVFVAGLFCQADSINTNGVARWTPGSGWDDVAGGIERYNIDQNGVVIPNSVTYGYMKHLLWVNGSLYGAGFFGENQNLDTGIPIRNFAHFDGNAWTLVDGIDDPNFFVNGIVQGLDYDPQTSQIMVLGSNDASQAPFSGLGEPNGFAFYNPVADTWSGLEGGVFPAAHCAIRFQGDLFIGGTLTKTDTTYDVHKIAKYENSTWDNLGSGPFNQTLIYGSAAWGDSIIVCGNFTNLGGDSIQKVGIWHPGQGWSSLGLEFLPDPLSSGNDDPYTVWTTGDTIFFGGWFGGVSNGTDTVISRSIAAYHVGTQTFLDLGAGCSGSFPNVYDFEWFQGDLCVAGKFSGIDGVSATGFAKWDGTQWSAIGTNPSTLEGYDLENINDTLLVLAASFQNINGNSNLSGAAGWDGTQFKSFGQGFGIGSRAYAVKYDSISQLIYFGGQLTSATQPGGTITPVEDIAFWDGSQWDGLDGLNASRISEMAMGAEGTLYFGGDITDVNGHAVNTFARWNPAYGFAGFGLGTNWEGSSTNFNQMNIVLQDSFVWMMGTFNRVGNGQAHRLSRYLLDDPGSGLLTLDLGGDQTVCDSVILDPMAGTGLYVWSDSSSDSTLTVTMSGTYGLTFTNVGGCSATDSVTITVEEAAGASFSAVLDTSTYTISLTNTSTNANSFVWDFGDGSTSVAQDTNHTYLNSGTYTVALIAFGTCGNDTAFQTFVVDSCDVVTAFFTFLTDTLEVSFSDQSTGKSINNWVWDFGDGTGSSMPNPQHTYAFPGVYQVAFIVSGDCGSDTIFQTITLTCDGPVAAFSFTPGPGLQQVQFNDQSVESLGIVSRTWDFGDGNSSSDPDPIHTYLNPGTYTVTLIVTDTCGTDTTFKDITITCPLPEANFSFSPGQAFRQIQFTDQSTDGGGITGYNWDFGDGNGSTLPSPIHTYPSAGLFQVSLIVSDSCGQDTSLQDVMVTCPEPSAAFSFSIDTLNKEIQVTNESMGDSLTFSWLFSTGSTSSQVNPVVSYQSGDDSVLITLLVTNPCGVDTAIRWISPPNTLTISELTGSRIDIFPNPGTGTITVRWEEGYSPVSELSIITTAGTTVMKKQDLHPNDQEAVFVLDKLPGGMYFLRIDTRRGHFFRRLILL